MDPAGGGEMGKVIELYTCSMCGITSETHKAWGPICRKTGSRVCDECCFRCEHHITFSGVWDCNYITPEEKRKQALKRAQDRFDAENRRVSELVRAKWREEAKKRAIKNARRRSGKRGA